MIRGPTFYLREIFQSGQMTVNIKEEETFAGKTLFADPMMSETCLKLKINIPMTRWAFLDSPRRPTCDRKF